MIQSPNSRFHFADAMQQSIGISDTYEADDFGPLFSLSPITSPECTPPASPQSYSPPRSPTPEHHAHVSAHVSMQAEMDQPPSKRPRTEAATARKAREKAKARLNQKTKNAQRKAAQFSHHHLRANVQRKIKDKSHPIPTPMGYADDARVVETGYSGLNDHGRRGKKGVTIHELVGEGSKYGFTYVPWDGRTPTPLVSADGYLCGVLAGSPDSKEWPRLHKAASDALEEARGSCSATRKERHHRRGRFTALRCGVLHGTGTTHPTNASNSAANADVLASLNKMEPFRRLAGFASSVMATWAPEMHRYYATTLKLLHESDPSLARLFPTSVFSTTTYNLGPQTVCEKHTDFQNLAFGWCAVTALGSFDFKKGGHIILWDLHLVVEFPPGATVLIPSAIIAHSNTQIQPGEKRYSFTQYTPAGLFRWVEDGFRTVEAMTAAEKTARGAANKLRWKYGLSLTPNSSTE